MKIKICGITNLRDAQYAVDQGATHLGFILYPQSPRYCAPETIAEIIAAISGSVTTVGVFVDESVNTIHRIVDQTGLTCVQLHGTESVEMCQQLRIPVIKAFRIATASDLDGICDYVDFIDAILLDTYVSGQPGGTGQSFNWNLAVLAKQWSIPLFLSGGLTLETVTDAIRFVQPIGVDVSSGVEVSPGQKNLDQVAAFVDAARSFLA